MLLTIDIGNTHTVLGLYQAEQLCHHWRIRTDRYATADELATQLNGLLQLQGEQLSTISGAVMGSVVPTLKLAWRQFCQQFLGLEIMVIGHPGVEPGIAIQIDNPQEVGADRVINSVAGFTRYGQALIIVDFGTAITFDCVADNGDYIGGIIAPGLAISLDALSSRTAKLPRVDISKTPEKAIATSTEGAIRAGLLFGYGGMVEGIVNRLMAEFPQPPLTIATGGMAPLVAPYAPVIKEVVPTLTLEGLRLIYERNRT